jgi:hypothetical protein
MTNSKSTEMRVIKFRAWGTWASTIPIQMWYPGKCDYGITFDGQVVYLDWGGGVSELVGLTLMQYTGLKDKNGKEIYESDLVRWEDGSNGTVVWNNELGCYLLGDGIKKFDYINWGKCEVVGNLFENPELI